MADSTETQHQSRRRSPVTLAIHAHFYQPPRENPWTEEVNREASAAPFHDWNARIAAESYRPNAFARILDGDGRVLAVVNNYENLSFNIGPTLMSWLERHRPDVYARILAAHRATGGAIAQAFNHMILPLANERDVRTQVRWGLADFRHRFGVDPAGMWLPETAVDDATLTVLAEEGVGFTVLAPSQARAIRPLHPRPGQPAAGGAWREPAALDTRVPYRWQHPAGDGRGVDIVFYDGALSHDLAFSALPSEALVDRATAAARRRGGLVTVALDGETFGHHHKWADRALAYALTTEAPRREVAVTNLAGWLGAHRPVHEVAVRESAWSCAHGVGRWATDCGCSTGGAPGSHQRWRAPLRAALDLLRDFGVTVFERRADLFADGDQWAARDAYIDVLVGACTREEFAARFVRGDPTEAFTHLEVQRNAMLMYTSCGWFFHDLAGLETIQVLRYAARVLDLLAEAGESPPEEEFLAQLAKAESLNHGDGRRIWAQLVVPARVDASRVAGHLVLADLFGLGEPADHLGGFEVETLGAGQGARQRAGSRLSRAVGRPGPAGPVRLAWRHVRLTHRRTGRTSELVAVALRLGDREAAGAVRPAVWPHDAMTLDTLRRLLEGGTPPGEVLERAFAAFGPEHAKAPGRVFDVSAMLPEAAEALLERASAGLAAHLAEAAEPFLAAAHWAVLTRPDHQAGGGGEAAGDPLPGPLRAAAEAAVAHRVEAQLSAGELRAAVELAGQARSVGLRLDRADVDPAETGKGGPAAAVSRIVADSVRHAVAERTDEAAKAAVAALELAGELGIAADRDESQELVFEALQDGPRPDLRELAEALGLSPLIFADRG